jgi:hypothetical protein
VPGDSMPRKFTVCAQHGCPTRGTRRRAPRTPLVALSRMPRATDHVRRPRGAAPLSPTERAQRRRTRCDDLDNRRRPSRRTRTRTMTTTQHTTRARPGRPPRPGRPTTTKTNRRPMNTSRPAPPIYLQSQTVGALASPNRPPAAITQPAPRRKKRRRQTVGPHPGAATRPPGRLRPVSAAGRIHRMHRYLLRSGQRDG